MARGSKCIYKKLENGIQEFVFRQSSHAAVDEFIDHLNWMVTHDEDYEKVTTTHLLMDTRQSGALPMYYIAKRVSEWTRSQHTGRQNRTARTAQLYNASNAYVTIARNLGKVFTNKNAKQEYFHNDRDAAIAWLLKND